MAEGKVKKIVSEKGFGFIEGDRGDVFFHHSALVGIAIEELQEGDVVSYDIGQGPKGPRAENVQRA
jgi:CspA family cold shock protein